MSTSAASGVERSLLLKLAIGAWPLPPHGTVVDKPIGYASTVLSTYLALPKYQENFVRLPKVSTLPGRDIRARLSRPLQGGPPNEVRTRMWSWLIWLCLPATEC